MTENLFSYILMPAAIAFIMFGIGINLRFSDFRNTFQRPKAVITGLAAQMILLPIIAFLINVFFDIEDNTSPDGDYILTPANAIMEMKFPEVDIKGKLR